MVIGICIFTFISSLPCLHTVLQAIPTSFFPTFLMLFSGNKTAFVHAYMIRNINGVLHNGKQSSSVVTIFTEQGKVEAVKSLSGYDAVR